MSDDTIRELLEERIAAVFPTYEPSVAVKFANTRFEQPTTAWIYVAVMPNSTERAAIGNQTEFESCGVINVTCMVPEMTGTKHVRQIGDAVAKTYLDCQIAIPAGGHITTYGVSFRERGQIEGWYTCNVFIQYRARVRITR